MGGGENFGDDSGRGEGGRSMKGALRSPWAIVLGIWALLVLAPDLLVRGRQLTPMYAAAVVGSWLLWGSVLAVLSRLRGLARPLAVGLAIFFAAFVTLAVAGALGYYQFFKKDVLALEWEFVLENPAWAYILASHAMTPLQGLGLLLLPLGLASALFRLGASAGPRGPASSAGVARQAAGIGLSLAAAAGITLFCHPLSADLLGMRAITFGTLSYVFHGSHPHTLPAPRRVQLAPRAPAHAPDVVLIINESVGRRESLGEGGQFPRLAEFLARHGGRAAAFPSASAVATATCVSIPTILAGLDPQQPREDFARAPLLWHAARAHGYRTALFSAQEFIIDFFSQFFLGADAPDVARTAPDYRHPPERVNELGVDDRLAVDAAIGFIKEAPRDRPFLVVIQLNATHWPCWAPALGVGKWRDSGKNTPSLDPQRCAQATRFVDEQARRVVDALAELGRLDRTLLLGTSDHGEVFRPGRPQRRYSYYQEVLAVPFFVYLPASLAHLAPVLRDNAKWPVNNLDIVPTVLDAWGDWPLLADDPRPRLPGHSLLRPLPPRVLVSMTDSSISREAPGFAVFHGRYKWSFSEETGGQLFDLETDPLEEHDLSAQAPAEEVLVLTEELRRRPYLKKVVRDTAPRLFPAVTAAAAAPRAAAP